MIMLYLVHYAEIATKGDNRPLFEKKLVDNIKKALVSEGLILERAEKKRGRILLYFNNQANEERIQKTLRRIFGVAYFARAYESENDLEAIKACAVNLLRQCDFNTFRCDTKRSNKRLNFDSQQANETVGEAIMEQLGKKVDLHQPELRLFMELTDQGAYLYHQKIKGPGGLPVGINGRVVVLLSGGIDSPVAAWYLMKRGIEVVLAHCHTHPFSDDSTLNKVQALAKVLGSYQGPTTLYLVPFGVIQQAIFALPQKEWGCVHCKRLMLRLAERIAQKEQIKALGTGENLGQVASQTLENLSVTNSAVGLPILRPLLCFDKEEIIKVAKAIGTFEVSIWPSIMFCAQLLPNHPATKAKLNLIQQAESQLDQDNLLNSALKQSEVKVI